jgi:hypothetical protein
MHGYAAVNAAAHADQCFHGISPLSVTSVTQKAAESKSFSMDAQVIDGRKTDLYCLKVRK